MAETNTYEKIDLTKALEHIEQTLSGVLSGIEKLNEESQQAKEDITAAFNRQRSHLHNREIQLLRQVDVIFRARGEVLHKQLAYCYRILGSLETSKKWTDQLRKYKCEVAVGSSEFEGMKKWTTVNPLNWTLDEEQLKEAISNFGKVDMDGVVLLPNVEESKCLPAKVEEYIEEDHQVLDKPLNMETDVIDIKFPKLPTKNRSWFSFTKQADGKPDSSYGPYRKGTDSYKPCDVQTWLGCIQTEIAAEPMEEVNQPLQTEFVLSDTASVKSSKESESIEIVSISSVDSIPDEQIEDPEGPALVEFEDIPSSYTLGPIQSDTNVNQGNYVVPAASLPLPDFAPGDDFKKWLRPATPPSQTAIIGNFVIFSLDEDKSKWLRPTTPPTLPPPVASSPSSGDASVFSTIYPGEERAKWLVNPSERPPAVSLFSKFFSDDDGKDKWLRPASPSCALKGIKTVDVLPAKFSDDDNSKWLHPTSLNLARQQSNQGLVGDNVKYLTQPSFYHPTGCESFGSLPLLTEALNDIKLKDGSKVLRTQSYAPLNVLRWEP